MRRIGRARPQGPTRRVGGPYGDRGRLLRILEGQASQVAAGWAEEPDYLEWTFEYGESCSGIQSPTKITDPSGQEITRRLNRANVHRAPSARRA